MGIGGGGNRRRLKRRSGLEKERGEVERVKRHHFEEREEREGRTASWIDTRIQ